jgi:alpha-beta hydrolase superfamily lysophospholipase
MTNPCAPLWERAVETARRVSGTALRTALAGLLAVSIAPAWAKRFERVSCPEALKSAATCHQGRDSKGAYVLVALPTEWNGTLIVHAHGGPRLDAPKADDSIEDLTRYAVLVKAGYAWVGSTYRRGGYGVRVAAADVERSRKLFLKHWSKPKRILLHGQSWGGNVVAKLAELYALDSRGRPRYDAVLTTNGVLMGGTRAYGFRADLRAIWQYYCKNHPAADEKQYPLWQGLPSGAKMTRDELNRRIDDCTGLSSPGTRTAQQTERLRDILSASGVAEAQLASHLAWATFHFQDLVHKRLAGRNPFDNRNTVYRGTADDQALNAGVQRFDADPVALAKLAFDADLSGLIVLPTLNVHASLDPVVSPNALRAYAAIIQHAGRSHLLAQVITKESDHSRLQDSTYMAAVQTLERWLDTGRRPDAASMQQICESLGDGQKQCEFMAP